MAAFVVIPRSPSCRGLQNMWRNITLFRSYSCMCSTLTPCQEPHISCRVPRADHPPLFCLVKEPKGNHISKWIPSLFICTMLITASKKDQSYLNYPQSLQPPEDSPQYKNNEGKTASTFIFTLLSKWVIFVRSVPLWPEVSYSSNKCTGGELKIGAIQESKHIW